MPAGPAVVLAAVVFTAHHIIVLRAFVPWGLTLKASAAMGSIRRLVVGDEAVQLIDVIAGELIDRVTEGEKAVAGGEVLVCSRIKKNP
jgi:hypothetical protein